VRKKVIYTLKVVGLLALIAAAGLLISTQFREEVPGPGAIIRARPLEKIDYETFELITLTMDEWGTLGMENYRSENPSTGTFSMTIPMICGSCGEKIPSPLRPDNYDEMRGGRDAYMNMLEGKYVCPKCGKKAVPR